MSQDNDSINNNITLSSHKFTYKEGDKDVLSDLYLKIQFPDVSTRDKFKLEFLENARNNGIGNPENLLHSRIGVKELYISPARAESQNLGVYRSRKNELAIDFGSKKMLDWFAYQLGITEGYLT